MNYPTEILPNENYKLITCDLSNFYLIRHTPSNNPNDLWDNESSQIQQKAICTPSEQIEDLSTSLLGVYDFKHLPIELTTQGVLEFSQYCQPNETIIPPIFNLHYVLNENRGFWVVLIGEIQDQRADFTFGDIEGKFQAICKVIHTPAKWNFWHFSIRWFLPDKNLFLNEMDDDKIKRRYKRRLSGEARALIARFADISEPDDYSIQPDCYFAHL